MAGFGSRVSGFFSSPTSGGGGSGFVPYTGATQNVDLGIYGIKSEYFEVNTATPYTPAVARMGWNPDYGTYDLTFGDGTVNNIGQQLEYPPCVNKTLVTLPYGCCVMANPSNPVQGNDVSVVRMVSDGTYPAKLLLGLLTTDVAPDEVGHVCWFGDLLNVDSDDINLNGETWAEGDILYPDPVNDGGLTKVQPDAPNIDISVCIIKKVSGKNIDLLVRPTITPNLSELNDVSATSPSNKDGIFYNSSTSRYENNSISGVLGYTPANALNWLLQAYQDLGSTFKSYPLTMPQGISGITTNTALTSTSARFVVIYIPVGATITGVKWYQTTQGVYTASNYNGVGLYTYSAGNMTLVASSTNDGDTWKGANNTWQTKAFSSTYVATAGVYVLCALYNSSAQTTAPAIGAAAGASNNGVMINDFTNSAKISASLPSQSTLPASTAMSSLTVTNVNTVLWVY